MSEDRQHKMLSLNSLPRLFGKRKAKKPGERVDHVVEGRGARGEENQQVNHTNKVTSTKSLVVNSSQPSKGDQMVVTKSLVELPLSSGGSSSNQSMTTAYSEHSFNNENLYVNGQVPRGQFKEYFSVPALEHRLERLEAQSLEPENGPAKPRRSFILGPDSSFFSRNVTTRKSALSMQPQPSSLPIPVFERAGSERGSLRKARSVDDFVESAGDRFEDTLNTLIGSPNTMGLPPKNSRGEEEEEEEDEEEAEECAYYNVQFARKARSSSQLQSLTQQSLRHHDSKQIAVTDSNYIQHLIKAQQRDPFGTSFLGHSLVTDKAEESMNTMVCDLDDNTLENSLIDNQLDELDSTLLVNNNNGQESPKKCEKQVLVEKNCNVLPKSNNVLQSNFLQSTLINNTNTTLSLGNALKCNTISKINMIPFNNRSRKNILSHTNNLNMDSTYQVLQSTMVNNKKEGCTGDALSLDSGAGSLGPCSLLGPEQSAIGIKIDTPGNIHLMA